MVRKAKPVIKSLCNPIKAEPQSRLNVFYVKNNSTPSSDVTVVGAGAIGATIALDLAERGAKVTLLERGPTVAAECSAANAGVIGASYVLPLASPDALRVAVTSLFRPDAPFSLKARPALVPWLVRFLVAAMPKRRAEIAGLLNRLALESADLHAALGARLDVGYERRGFLAVYEQPEALSAANERGGNGSSAELLDGAALHARVPWLRDGLRGGINFEHDAHVDPPGFVRAVAEEAQRLGASIRTGVDVWGIERSDGRAVALNTNQGTLRFSTLVIATGAWSPVLGRDLGMRLPVQGGKGYAIEFKGNFDVTCPVYFPERHVVLTPLRDRLRLTGMLELCGTDLSVDARRVATIRRSALGFAPFLEDLEVSSFKAGLRPCTPDGLPIVGRVPGLENAWVSTGHSMWGLQLAPITARLLGDAISGNGHNDSMLRLLSPTRF